MNAIAQPAPHGSAEPNMLTMLMGQPIWLLWRSIPNIDLDKKPRKVPYYACGRPRNGELDSAEDRGQLVSHAVAVAAYDNAAPGAYAGLAVALGPDGRGGCVQGIDLDGIVDAGLTDIADLWTRGPCAGLGYVETSPSGTGLHLLGYGRAFRSLGANASGIEAYGGGRFFTFTGRPIVADSPCRTYDPADYVETVLAVRHGAARPSSANDTMLVRVDARTVDELRSALAHMPSTDRDLWQRMGHALKTLGSTGCGLWTEWSQKSKDYRPLEDQRTWDGFAPRNTGYQAVFAEALRRGWVNPREIESLRHGAAVAEALLQDLSAATASTNASARRLVSRSLGGVAARAIDWLWTGWMPKGYITIFAGESGAGKSTVLADVAARVTTGRPWPGEPAEAVRPPARVLWLGSEDGIEEMTVPRLLACGADTKNVIEIQGVSHQGRRSTFSMQDDIDEVERTLAWAREDGLPFAMLVIDPVTSYLPGQKLRKVDLNDAGQLRTILEPWLPMAQRHNIAIVCVTHFAKDTTKSMLHRVMGSAAFAQTCRSLCAVVEREATDDYEPEPHEKGPNSGEGELTRASRWFLALCNREGGDWSRRAKRGGNRGDEA